MVSHARHLHDQITEAQKRRKDDQARTANRSMPPGGSEAPSIDWQHVQDLAERTRRRAGERAEVVRSGGGPEFLTKRMSPERVRRRIRTLVTFYTLPMMQHFRHRS